MTIERAIEILDPKHREVYESIDPVNEACEMGQKALWRLKPLYPEEKEIVYDDDWGDKMTVRICPSCRKQVLPTHVFCPRCGQALMWKEEE